MNIENRSCTDILMLILFCAMIVSMGYFTVMGNKYGNPEKLMAPLDGNNNFCGHTEGFEDYKKLYITSMKSINIKTIFNSGVCVKECPVKGATSIDCKTTEGKVENCNTEEILAHVYPTTSIAKFCIPNPKTIPEDFKEGLKILLNSFANTSIGSYFKDMYLSSNAMYTSLGMGMVYCLLYIYLMSIFAEHLAWVCVVLVQLGLAFGTFLIFNFRKTQLQSLAEQEEILKDLSGDELIKA